MEMKKYYISGNAASDMKGKKIMMKGIK